jgi:hypothetical protein
VCEPTTDDFDPKSIGLPMHTGVVRTRLRVPALQRGVVNKRQLQAVRTGRQPAFAGLVFGTFLVPPTKKHLTITRGSRQVLDVSTKFGRREWTRTIDPHHVKVVL